MVVHNIIQNTCILKTADNVEEAMPDADVQRMVRDLTPVSFLTTSQKSVLQEQRKPIM